MKPKDIFSIAVRVLGLVFLYHGLLGLPPLVGQMFSVLRLFNLSIIFPVFASALLCAWSLLLAYWCLRGAPQVVSIAYPEMKNA